MIVRKIDDKYHVDENGAIVNTSSGELLPADEPLFLLRARDTESCKTLMAYGVWCRDAGAPAQHGEEIDVHVQRFAKFAQDHPERMKVPGTKVAGATSTGSGV